MKIHLVGTEMFHADGWTDGHDKANSHFSQFCEHASNGCMKNHNQYKHSVHIKFGCVYLNIYNDNFKQLFKYSGRFK